MGGAPPQQPLDPPRPLCARQAVCRPALLCQAPARDPGAATRRNWGSHGRGGVLFQALPENLRTKPLVRPACARGFVRRFVFEPLRSADLERRRALRRNRLRTRRVRSVRGEGRGVST